MIKAASHETLHIINKSPGDILLYQNCFSSLLAGDAVLFIESAVYAAIDDNFQSVLDLAANDIPFFTLQDDLIARGLNNNLNLRFKAIEDNYFVELCCLYKKSISWF